MTRKTTDCRTWMPMIPKNAFHHRRAAPSVAGEPWQASRSGAATTRTRTQAMRTRTVATTATAMTVTARANTTR
ncbi:hypothetical protein DN069_12920 [Streptacidiphilus pinicola]|uniref:Uncharacterized protein n=1 Tax=Streptacidiphilus pinicola TaxID=2219663 RepID=A0A2X0K7F2_9ACTN|nr:hypothetical protein DN069_12920 [Streptacidiphilus pinicola]